jgi:hypothetical protein
MADITIDWPAQRNEHGRPLLWFASWLVGDDGSEGEAIYNGRGGEQTRCPVPRAAIGLRIRRWPNEGFDAEYVDLIPVNGTGTIHPDQLDFDVRQRFSLLPEDFA